MQMGLSESARATTSEASRYRINYPNSRPRTSRIIALDAPSFEMLKVLTEKTWSDAHFLRYVAAKPAVESLQMLSIDATLEDADGRHVSLVDEIANADVIVMVTSAGAPAGAAEVIGNASFVRNKLTTGLVLNASDAGTDDLMRTLHAMRPFAAMLVVSTGLEYVDEMLSALRA
jgi:hypothetical protein